MKRYLTKTIYFLAITFLVVSCEKDYKDPARITYFADMVMEGDPEVYHQIGTPYVDPPVTAMEAGNGP